MHVELVRRDIKVNAHVHVRTHVRLNGEGSPHLHHIRLPEGKNCLKLRLLAQNLSGICSQRRILMGETGIIATEESED